MTAPFTTLSLYKHFLSKHEIEAAIHEFSKVPLKNVCKIIVVKEAVIQSNTG